MATIKEVDDFLKRIKLYYSDFNTEKDKVSEWYSMLKEYDIEDLNQRFSLHLKSETYGDYPPKINYLLAGLIKSEHKNLTCDYIIYCPICSKEMLYSVFDKHYARCSAIKYIEREIKLLFDKDVNREALEQLNDKDFEYKYKWLLNKKYESIGKLEGHKREKMLLECALYGQNYSLDEVISEQ